MVETSHTPLSHWPIRPIVPDETLFCQRPAMRRATIVVAALIAFACRATHAAPTASTPTARVPVDSGVVLFNDSLAFRDMRRALAALDSVAREGRETPEGKAQAVAPFGDSLLFRDMRRVITRLDSLFKHLRATPIERPPRTVFTDSALHVAVCAPSKAGDDWRRVCVPKDQSVNVR
jgi:hypothetical protein